jgi:hypothetical protein
MSDFIVESNDIDIIITTTTIKQTNNLLNDKQNEVNQSNTIKE